jgi:Integrase core domain
VSEATVSVWNRSSKKTASNWFENSYIESFNGRLRDECLKVDVFFTLTGVRDKLECWRQDYNPVRPRSALRDHPPALFAVQSPGASMLLPLQESQLSDIWRRIHPPHLPPRHLTRRGVRDVK